MNNTNTIKTSIAYKLFILVIKSMGIKRLSILPENRLLEKVADINRKRPFRVPSDTRFHYEDRLLFNHFHCLKIQTGREKSKKAVLFLYGGGYVMAPMKIDLMLAKKIAGQTASDVWFLYYPLCNEHSIRTTFEVAYASYRCMLQSYAARNISFLGISSGASLAIGICQHNNMQETKLPMPRRIIAVSPGGFPVTEAEKEKMAQLSKRDSMMDAVFIPLVKKLMQHGQTLPEYMLSARFGDFSDFPPIHFYYGSDETLYAIAESYQKACEKYQVKYDFHIGQGMCHSYAMLPYFPEGKQAFREIIDYLLTIDSDNND